MTGITMNYQRDRKTQAVSLKESVLSLRPIYANLTDEQFVQQYSKKYTKDKASIRKILREHT